MSAPAEDLAPVDRRVIPRPGCDLVCWHRPGDGRRWILWVHGAGGSHLMWAAQADAFPGVDHLFLDVRGQGESVLHAGQRATFEDVVADLPAVLDAYDVDRAVLVGHSWGGNPCQEVALRHPERVDGLVMVGAWGQHRPMSSAERRMIAVNGRVYRRIPWRWLAAYSGRWASDVPETRAAVTESLLATDRDVYVDLGLTAYRAVHQVDEYPTPVSTLLLRGERDSPKVLARIYAGLCRANPLAREVVLPATGHQPMMDVPDAFDAEIAGFLADLPQPDPR